MHEVNLLPPKKQAKTVFPVAISVALTTTIISLFVFLLIGAYVGFLFRYHDLQKKSDELSTTIQNKSTSLQKIKQIQQDKQEFETTLTGIENLVQNRVIWSGLLLDLNILETLGLQYTELKMYTILEKTEISEWLVPKVDISGEAESILTVANLYKDLRRLTYLSDVKMKSVEQITDSKNVKFLITAVLIRKNEYVS